MFMAYAFTIAAVIMDVRTGKIRNRLILVGLGISLVLHIQQNGWMSITSYLLQISFPVIMLYLFFLLGALGAGDIKLFSLISGFIGLKKLMVCILVAFIFGAGMSFFVLLIKGRLWTGLKEGLFYLGRRLQGKKLHGTEKINKIPFSIAILTGLVITSFI